MKKTLLLFIVTLITNIVVGQNISISFTRENIIYRGIPNPISVVVENMKCGSFFITTDNGKITGDSCSYLIKVKRLGKSTIYINKIVETDTVVLGTAVFAVKDIPKPSIYVDGLNNGKITKENLLAQGSFKARLDNFDLCITYHIMSYSVVFLKKNNTFNLVDVKTSVFSEELINEFKALRKNDKLIITDIKVREPSGRIMQLQPVDITIE